VGIYIGIRERETKVSEHKGILAAIKLKYDGEVLAAMLEAWEIYPTLKSDCMSKRMEKEYERRKWVRNKLGLKILA
jgi:hypothetical protein